MNIERLHTPAVAKAGGRAWGVYCLACSEQEGDYVYPCEVRDDVDEWPPHVLVEPFAEPSSPDVQES